MGRESSPLRRAVFTGSVYRAPVSTARVHGPYSRVYNWHLLGSMNKVVFTDREYYLIHGPGSMHRVYDVCGPCLRAVKKCLVHPYVHPYIGPVYTGRKHRKLGAYYPDRE